LLNHFPTIGFSVGLGLFVVSMLSKGDDLKRASLVIFFLIAVISIPTYLSGNAAHEAIQDLPEVSAVSVGAHEDAALIAFAAMQITGFMAWIALWQYRQTSIMSRWNLSLLILLSSLTFVLMARTAYIGGLIRHPEINGAQASDADGQILPNVDAVQTAEVATEEEGASSLARAAGRLVTDHSWVWPAAETLHFIGLCILFTVVLIVDLRILGMVKSISLATAYQLMPVGMLGFVMNLVTGMLFFLSTPEQYANNIAFHWKIFCLVLAGINVLYFIVLDEAWCVGPGEDAPLRAKVVAVSTIVLWGGVLYFGHMLPFIGNAF
jgi:hypothetical protein